MVTSTSAFIDLSAPQPVETPVEPPTVPPRNKVETHFHIETMDENPDGSIDMLINMDYASMVHYARIGLMKVLSDAAEKAIKDHGQV